MGKVFADHSMLLDGFRAGPNVRMDNGMGDGGEALHVWMLHDDGKTEHRGEALEDLFGSTGAVVVGRRMFDLGEKPWGENPDFLEIERRFSEPSPMSLCTTTTNPELRSSIFHRPVFVVTHRPKAVVTKQGGTTYTYGTGGFEAAVTQARAAAGDRDVVVLGGASIIQQCLGAGLLSELRPPVAHLLLGAGTSLFGGVDPATFALARTRLVDAEGVSHLTFRVDRPKARGVGGVLGRDPSHH